MTLIILPRIESLHQTRGDSTLTGPGGLTAWSDWAAQHGKRIGITWATSPKTPASWVRNVHSFVALSATQKRISYETTTTSTVRADHSSQQVAAAYLRLW